VVVCEEIWTRMAHFAAAFVAKAETATNVRMLTADPVVSPASETKIAMDFDRTLKPVRVQKPVVKLVLERKPVLTGSQTPVDQGDSRAASQERKRLLDQALSRNQASNPVRRLNQEPNR
jgi:hypothetical protein